MLAEQASLIGTQAAQILLLEKRIASLEDQLGLGGPPKVPPFVKANKPVGNSTKKRKVRNLHFCRRREAPTRTVNHVADECPDCGRGLSGGGPAVSRQVIDMSPSAVTITDHVMHDRWCGVCKKRVRAKVDLSGEVSGKCRLGHNLISWIANLHIEALVPLRKIQDILKRLHGVHVSIGEMTQMMDNLAAKAALFIETLYKEVRAGRVINADETGWRQNGQNGYLWAISNDRTRLFRFDEHRSAQVALSLIGSDFNGTLVTDFYYAYNPIPSRHQRCWPHFKRDLDKLRLHPNADAALNEWVDQVLNTWHRGREFQAFCLSKPKFGANIFDRRRRRKELEIAIYALAEPYIDANVDAIQHTLAKRIAMFLKELFTYVEFPEVPDNNNAAERAVRPAVIARKVCGGTRSEKGSQTKMTLMSLMGTWKLRGLDPIVQCRNLLALPP